MLLNWHWLLMLQLMVLLLLSNSAIDITVNIIYLRLISSVCKSLLRIQMVQFSQKIFKFAGAIVLNRQTHDFLGWLHLIYIKLKMVLNLL